MVPGDAAPLEEPDTASLEGPFVVAGAFVGRGAIEGGAVGRGAGAGAGVGRGAGASIGSSTT